MKVSVQTLALVSLFTGVVTSTGNILNVTPESLSGLGENLASR